VKEKKKDRTKKMAFTKRYPLWLVVSRLEGTRLMLGDANGPGDV